MRIEVFVIFSKILLRLYKMIIYYKKNLFSWRSYCTSILQVYQSIMKSFFEIYPSNLFLFHATLFSYMHLSFFSEKSYNIKEENIK